MSHGTAGRAEKLRAIRRGHEVTGPLRPARPAARSALAAGFTEALAHPDVPPPMAEFITARASYLRIFNTIMDKLQIDALFFPHARAELPPLHGDEQIAETKDSEINIAGLPGVTGPAGAYACAAPFGLIFAGRLFSEATQHRRAPALSH